MFKRIVKLLVQTDEKD